MATAEAENELITTADGVPLKESLKKALWQRKKTALLLVAPLFLFVLITFLIPIFDMLIRSVDNSIAGEQFPNVVVEIRNWDLDSTELPDEATFQALIEDFKVGAKEKTISRLGRRLNYEQSGMSGLFRKTARKIKKLESWESAKAAMIAIDKDWGDIETWRLIKRESGKYSSSYYLAAFDAQKNSDGSIAMKAEDQKVYIALFWRTIRLSFTITFLTIILGYPIAYLLSTVKTKTSNMLIILVLLPFWTSLLVRTSSWIALLQKEGVLNDILVGIGILGDDNRLAMIHNETGTVIAMTHILLPFMVLPLFSVMKTIPPSWVRAARSMGATPFTAFWRIYLPNTIPGIGAGGILVFILAIGYYITPALVGGTKGTLISNFIAYHISTSLNWGLAAALGTILLLLVLALYILYDKVVGINNMKLG
ncbi:MAG: ABC transporter permease [Gammaproteobacteria bacterium]|nr:ABC transporter permease [Gammaproteobacteria bacterium]MDH3858721.1 ABC transporter permease [Gammaproteobacteria bacterium]